MGLTHFPNGVSSYGVPVLGGSGFFTTGTPRFVSSTTVGSSDGNLGLDPTTPMATLDAAIGRTTANVGDVIFVMPNHAETVTGVAGIALDVAGLTVIGMGFGAQRPRFLMDGADSVTAAITVPDVTLSNMEFASGTSDTVTCFTTTALNSWFDNIVFTDNASNENWLTVIKATGSSDNDCDGLKVTGCSYKTEDVGVLEMIELTADVSGAVITDNLYLCGLATAAKIMLVTSGKTVQALYCAGNRVDTASTAGELLVEATTTNNTGMVINNAVSHLDVIGSHLMTGLDGVGHIENYSTGDVTLSGVIVPNIDVNL